MIFFNINEFASNIHFYHTTAIAKHGRVSTYKALDGTTIHFQMFPGDTTFSGYYVPAGDTVKYTAVGAIDTKEYLSVVSWTASLENQAASVDKHTVVAYVGHFALLYAEIKTSYTIEVKGGKPETGEKTFFWIPWEWTSETFTLLTACSLKQ